MLCQCYRRVTYVAVISAVWTCFCAGSQLSLANSWVPLDESRLEAVVGAPQDKKCHWTSRRHGCSYYNYACVASPTCTLTDPVTTIIKTCTNAVCKDSVEGNNCELEIINTTFNTCYITGDKNNLGCTGTEERCTLGMWRTWKEPNAASGPVSIEKATSKQCSDDPSINPNNGKQRAKCTPLPAGQNPVNDPNTPG